jgi:hypothetical protein
MAAYLILGAGRFGRLALKRLAAADPEASFTVVDRDSRSLAEAGVIAGDHAVTLIRAEAVTFLQENLGKDSPWDWIIPMVPVHVAFAWLRQTHPASSDWQVLEVPEAVGDSLPLVKRGLQGEMYLSRAAHLCPDDCPEPESLCPVSGEERSEPLYEELAGRRLPGCRWLVLPSRQLAPGVGGYAPGLLLSLTRDLSACRETALIATACRCHGVVHALARRRTP